MEKNLPDRAEPRGIISKTTQQKILIFATELRVHV